ncbi:MAG: hypothetical protein WAZ77_19435 [Candidatus Nitrosopolaris sp.]
MTKGVIYTQGLGIQNLYHKFWCKNNSEGMRIQGMEVKTTIIGIGVAMVTVTVVALYIGIEWWF